MSALLLKDYYVIFRQMKIFLLLILVFSCIPGTFYSTFAVVYASMLPYTALAYDERSRWDQMAAMMPYSARDVVLSKYLFGWIAVAVSAAATSLDGGFYLSLSLVPAAIAAVVLTVVSIPLAIRFYGRRSR